MSDESEKKIATNIRWVSLLIGLLLTLTGWIANRTLSNIDNSIKSLGEELKKTTESNTQVQYDLGIRLTKIEERLNMNLLKQKK